MGIDQRYWRFVLVLATLAGGPTLASADQSRTVYLRPLIASASATVTASAAAPGLHLARPGRASPSLSCHKLDGVHNGTSKMAVARPEPPRVFSPAGHRNPDSSFCIPLAA